MGASWRVLMLDKELLLLPLLSLAATGLVALTFVGPLAQDQSWLHADGAATGPKQFLAYARLFLFYVCTYFVVIFFNSALIASVHLRLQGQNPTLMDGLRGAWARLGTLLAWTIIAATVGLLLHMLRERSKNFVGAFLAGLLEFAWGVATFFVIPILVIEGKGPIDAIQESATILKRTWGEDLIAGASYGLIHFACSLPAIAVGVFAFLTVAQGHLAFALFLGALVVFYLLLVNLTILVLESVFDVAVYHYARTGAVPQGFDAALLQSAFVKK